MLIIQALRRWKCTDPWDLLSVCSSLVDKSQAPMRDPVSKTEVDGAKRLTSTHACSHMHSHNTHKYS